MPMQLVTIKHKTSGRETQIYPTPASIERMKAVGWNVRAAEKALKAMTAGPVDDNENTSEED